MKQVLGVILAMTAVLGIITGIFSYWQVTAEQTRLADDLQYRTTLLAETVSTAIGRNFQANTQQFLQSVVDGYANRERSAGIGVFDNKGQVVAISEGVSGTDPDTARIVANAMDEDRAVSQFANQDDRTVFMLALPLLNTENRVTGALIVVQNASYIDDRIAEIWRNSLIRLCILVLVVSFVVLIFMRWILYEPVRILANNLKLARMKKTGSPLSVDVGSSFLRPLSKEISNMNKSLMEARMAAIEEARLALEKLDSPWTAERLKEFIRDVFKNRKIIIVSNREPYIHTKKGNTITYHVPASGMVTAMESVMQACGDTWIACGSGNADRDTVDAEDRVRVPPDDPSYTLKRVWLSQEEHDRYYNGFCNEGLWALCHHAHTRPIFRKEDWEEYKKVNAKFAKAVFSEIKNIEKPIIFIQDFHFALLPRMLKSSRPDATIALFWHIPWVSAESFSICPWKKDILDGMLGSDLIGFHTQLHCNNFIETVGRELESLINYEQFSVSRENHQTVVKPFPISISFTGSSPKGGVQPASNAMLKELGITTKFMGIGVDRLDYTKGIIERFKAIEIFLRRHPLFREKFSFLQIAAPSRTSIPKYQEFARTVEAESKRINAIFETKNWKPIHFHQTLLNHAKLQMLYRRADFCLVTSLHDGMNLVAKEYISARDDNSGVLIVSQFTGAAKELKDALVVNPYSGEETAEAIYTALQMPDSEKMKRMKKLRIAVKSSNIFRWSAEIFRTLTGLE